MTRRAVVMMPQGAVMTLVAAAPDMTAVAVTTRRTGAVHIRVIAVRPRRRGTTPEKGNIAEATVARTMAAIRPPQVAAIMVATLLSLLVIIAVQHYRTIELLNTPLTPSVETLVAAATTANIWKRGALIIVATWKCAVAMRMPHQHVTRAPTIGPTVPLRCKCPPAIPPQVLRVVVVGVAAAINLRA